MQVIKFPIMSTVNICTLLYVMAINYNLLNFLAQI